MLESIILAMVIGIIVIIGGFALIQKVFEERRKDNKEAVKMIKEVFNELPKAFGEMAEAILKKEKEQTLHVVHDDEY